jgi:leucyl aminopeptidase
MLIQLLRQPIGEIQASWLVRGVFSEEPEPTQSPAASSKNKLLDRLVEQKEISGSLGELSPLYDQSDPQAVPILIVGLGPRPKFDAGAAYQAGFAAAKRLSARPRESVVVELPLVPDLPQSAWLTAMVEGLVVGTRSPGLRKSEATRQPFANLWLAPPPETPEEELPKLDHAIRRGEIVGMAVNLARDLANTPPAEKTPMRLAEQVQLVAHDAGIEFQLWDETKIRQERLGGLLGVAAGSTNPPAFVFLEYRGASQAPPFALVGKGVTFDSGGLSLKPSASMEDMKSDMTGAAVVIATLQAIARLRLPIHVVGYLPLTENMTGGAAMKPGDVLTIRNGTTVEVLNTDAEGRLILADALCLATESKPRAIIDLATLTGACMVALGTKTAGLFTNNQSLSKMFLETCRQTGERAWRMPLDDDYKEQLKSQVADLKNVGGKWAGAITAAKFLESFVGSTPWVHLDIAGPSWCDSDNTLHDAGGTGCFVRSLVSFFEIQADAQTASSMASTQSNVGRFPGGSNSH